MLQKVKDWWNARRERIAEAKAHKHYAADQLHGHSRFWLLNVPVAATLCAATVEWYWAILFCIEATGHIDWNWETGFGSSEPTQNAWNFAFAAHIPVLIGLLAATAPIVMLSMVWLPVQFALRGAGRWRRGTIIAVGLLANILVIVSGTVVMNYNRQSQVRDALVVEQTAQQGRAALEAQRASIEQRRAALIEPSNTTLQAQAARAGVAGWDAYIETARRQAQEGTISPQRLALIERARGSAVAVEDYQRRIDDLTGQIAAAPTQAAVAANVQDNVGAELNTFSQYVEVWRPPFIALICTLIGIFGTWWVIAMLERMNPKDVLRSGWAPEELRIEDKRDEPAGEVQPMTPPRRRYTDAETGDEIEEVLIQPKKPRPYKKERIIKKGEKFQVHIQPDIPPDETGVEYDGGGRVGLSQEQPERDRNQGDATDDAEQPQNLPGDIPFAPTPQQQNSVGATQSAEQEDNTDRHPEPSYEPQETLSDEEAVALAEEYALAAAEETAITNQGNMPEGGPAQNADDAGKQVVAVEADDYAEDKAEVEGDVAQHTPPTDRQPETREDRLLPAVAAE